MGKDKKRIHVVSYTHWDREFRFDFETTRMRLVDLMDNLISIMKDNAEFRHYMLDGQFVIVDDYLEIRPEMGPELRQLAAEGRLEIGPWYTLPDLSCIHGESLIRNLMTGLKKSREFGGAMEVGYNVFSFGQIAQLPQIYTGFGIDFIIFYKYMDRKRSKFSEFIWEAPDGTKVLTSRLDREARWNFFFAGHIPIVYNLDPWHKDWQYKWGSMGKVFHMCEPANYAGFHDILEPETSFYRQNIRKGFERTVAALDETAVPEHLLFFDGTDFTEPHPLIPEIIRTANKELGEEYEVIHGTLSGYATAIKEAVKGKELETVMGQMKDGPVGAVHSDVCSIHPELKQENSRAENLLFRWAEPFATVAWTLGAKYPKTQIERALKFLFLSQAHDSLHGAGPQAMVADVENRLLQARAIAEGMAIRSFQSIASRVNTADDDTDVFLIVFNASPFCCSDVVEAYIDLPRDIPVDYLIIEDADGNSVPVHQLHCFETRAGIYHPRSRNMPFYANRFHVLFQAQNVPALGYKVFKVKWHEKKMYPYPHEDWDPLRIPYESLVTGPRQAENDRVSVAIADDGTLEIKNKTTGKVLRGLNYLMDSGEGGNLYFHCPPAVGCVVTTLGSPARISLIINSPLMARFRVETSMRLPSYFDKSKGLRSSQETEVPITSEVTLRRDSDVVEVVTTVDNRVKDHFLRACFLTGIKAEDTYAEGSFDVAEYPTRISREGNFQGQELTRHQMHLFMDINDGKEGFSILSDAVRDYEVINPDSGTIALSLVRGTKLRIPVDNRLWMEYPGDESAQSLGMHTMRYGLYVHQGGWEKGKVYQQALAFNTPFRAAQMGRQEGSLPYSQSFLQIKPDDLILSALKKAEDRETVIVRLYNPTQTLIKGKLSFGKEFSQAYQVNLNEERLKKIELADKKLIPLSVPPKKIIGVEIEGADK